LKINDFEFSKKFIFINKNFLLVLNEKYYKIYINRNGKVQYSVFFKTRIKEMPKKPETAFVEGLRAHLFWGSS
jgi:hypothetical protein